MISSIYRYVTGLVRIAGTADDGSQKLLNATPEGHLEVAVHSPRLPFGSIHTESLTPLFQFDFVYGVDGDYSQSLKTTSLSGQVSTTISTAVLSSGTTQYAQAVLQSRKRLRYRPGQGSVQRFTAAFSAGTASSYQVAGIGHSEDGLFFGYKNGQFGILHSHHGFREIQTYTVSTASTNTENVYVVLNGVTNTVAVTNSGNTNRTAYELALGTYTGWRAEVVGATVVFLANDAGDKAGAFTITATSIVGSFAETRAGVAATESFTTQDLWNGDPLDGSGASGYTLVKDKLNVYQIGMQYLGAGAIEFKVEVPFSGNNAEFVTVHTINPQGQLSNTSLGNPSMPFTAAVYSAGSQSDLQIRLGSVAGFIEGEKRLQGNRFSYTNSRANIDAAAYYNLFSIRNALVFNGKANQAIINLLSVVAALKHNNPCTIYVLRNAALVGNPVFTQYSSNSCSFFSNAATSCTFSDNAQLIWSGSLGDTGDLNFNFEDDLTLQPGEMITIAARTVFGTASWVVAGANTREDH